MAEIQERNRERRLAELATPPDPIADQVQEDAERIAAADAAGDPLAAQIAGNEMLDRERHPVPAPTRVEVNVAEDQQDRDREVITGRVEIRQTGHLGRAQ